MTDQPTEEYEPYREAQEAESWPDQYPADDRPPPPTWTEVPAGSVIIRDQTAPRWGAAQELTHQLDQLDEKRGRLPSGEVRAIVGQAAGTIEALEDQAERVPDLLQEIEDLTAQLSHAQGQDDEQAMRLWKAGKLAEAQGAAERLYASARAHAEAMVRDTRAHCDGLLAEAQRRAELADPSFPSAPEEPEDRIDRAVIRARYLDAVRSWLAEQDADLDGALEALGAELEEAQKLRARTS